MTSKVWEIFKELTEYIIKKNKDRNAVFDFYKYNSDGKSYLLIPFSPQYNNISFKFHVMPLIDGEQVPYGLVKPFISYTHPLKRFNAFAYIYAGYTNDRFRVSRGGPVEKKARTNFVVNELIPLFLNDLNEFFSTKTINNRQLKAEIVNNKYELFDNIYHEKNDVFSNFGNNNGWPICIKLAIAISYK